MSNSVTQQVGGMTFKQMFGADPTSQAAIDFAKLHTAGAIRAVEPSEVLDLVASLRMMILEDRGDVTKADEQAFEDERSRSDGEPCEDEPTRQLEDLADAAVKVGILLGNRPSFDRPIPLLGEVCEILRKAGLPDASKTETLETYTADALETFGHAINAAKGTP